MKFVNILSGAEKKKAAGKKYKENLMSSRLAEADFGTPLLDDYEELDVYQIDSLKSADNPPNTGMFPYFPAFEGGRC